MHPVSALLRSPHIEPVDDVIVREPGKLHKAVAEQLDQPRIMGSLPHGVSPGISLSLGDDWCGQVHREHWRLGLWREASPAYFSAQPLGPKLRLHGSTGPPLPSLALQAKKRSRWRHQAAGDQSTSSNSSSSFTQNVSLSQIDQNFCQAAHISPPSAAHGYRACSSALGVAAATPNPPCWIFS